MTTKRCATHGPRAWGARGTASSDPSPVSSRSSRWSRNTCTAGHGPARAPAAQLAPKSRQAGSAPECACGADDCAPRAKRQRRQRCRSAALYLIDLHRCNRRLLGPTVTPQEANARLPEKARAGESLGGMWPPIFGDLKMNRKGSDPRILAITLPIGPTRVMLAKVRQYVGLRDSCVATAADHSNPTRGAVLAIPIVLDAGVPLEFRILCPAETETRPCHGIPTAPCAARHCGLPNV